VSETGYAAAMAELEGILAELEGEHLDVDLLADRVRRASELIKLCRTRIARAQDEVAMIVTDLETFGLDPDAPPAGADAPADADAPDELF
jgi:exodeoxyribonuclease VII small subunit